MDAEYQGGGTLRADLIQFIMPKSDQFEPRSNQMKPVQRPGKSGWYLRTKDAVTKAKSWKKLEGESFDEAVISMHKFLSQPVVVNSGGSFAAFADTVYLTARQRRVFTN